MGRIYHKMGLKFGHKGLLYVLRDPENTTTIIKEICVTTDWEYVINLGKFPDYNTGKDSFIELYDVFDYVMQSPYFNSNIFLLENRNHISRVRDKKRISYMLFLKYIENKGDPTKFDWDKSTIKSEILSQLFKDFPKFKQEHDDVLENFRRNKRLHEKYNGNFVNEWTGLEGKELGVFMRSIKDEVLSDFIESNEITTIRNKVLTLLENQRKMT